MTTLVTGCSFVEHAQLSEKDNPIDFSKFVLLGKSGSGNTAIAASTLARLLDGDCHALVVLWSGIRRLDLPVSMDHRDCMSKMPGPAWHWWRHASGTAWYHSGGEAGSWTDGKVCPKNVAAAFRTQYTESSPQYFTDLTCLAVASVQNFCKVRNIPYRMAWIYDIHAPVTTMEHAHGQISPASALYSLVDWNTIETDTNVYQWCLERDLLSEDAYHPTTQGIVDYVASVLGINMAGLD